MVLHSPGEVPGDRRGGSDPGRQRGQRAGDAVHDLQLPQEPGTHPLGDRRAPELRHHCETVAGPGHPHHHRAGQHEHPEPAGSGDYPGPAAGCAGPHRGCGGGPVRPVHLQQHAVQPARRFPAGGDGEPDPRHLRGGGPAESRGGQPDRIHQLPPDRGAGHSGGRGAVGAGRPDPADALPQQTADGGRRHLPPPYAGHRVHLCLYHAADQLHHAGPREGEAAHLYHDPGRRGQGGHQLYAGGEPGHQHQGRAHRHPGLLRAGSPGEPGHCPPAAGGEAQLLLYLLQAGHCLGGHGGGGLGVPRAAERGHRRQLYEKQPVYAVRRGHRGGGVSDPGYRPADDHQSGSEDDPPRG